MEKLLLCNDLFATKNSSFIVYLFMDKLFLHTADCTAATPLEKIAGVSEGLEIKGTISKEAKPIHSKDFVLLCAPLDFKTFPWPW